MSVKSASGQHTLRERNLALVTQEVFAAPTPLSRAAISQRTGLTRATVSSLVDLLVDAAIVAELSPVVSRGAGRPAVPLVPARGTYLGLGLEVTVTTLSGVITDLTGTELARIEVPHGPSLTPADAMTALAQIATELIASATNRPRTADFPVIAGVQLALPGLVDPVSASVKIAPNLGWHNLDPVDTSAISAAIEQLTGQLPPIRIGNEAKYGAIAQTIDSPLSTFIYVSSDVGIGSSIMMDRTPFVGRRGWTGELGHVMVDPAGPLCSCGSHGCLERYAGREALYQATGLTSDRSFDAFAELLAARDPDAIAATERAGRALGAALADYVNLIDIDTIVLGGIYAPLTPYLEPIIVGLLNEKVLSAQWSDFQVVAAPTEHGAATVGAAHQALRAVIEQPAQWIHQDTE